MSFAEAFAHTCQASPDREAAVCGSVRLTYADLGRRVAGLASGLVALGLGRGEHVAVLEKNCHRYLEIYLAAATTGTVLVPLNYRLAPRELAEILADAEVHAILVGLSFLPLLETLRSELPALQQVVVLADHAPDGYIAYEPLLQHTTDVAPPVRPGPDDLRFLFYTSGTTGQPKGIMLSEANVSVTVRNVQRCIGFTKADRFLHIAPLFHNADAVMLWAAMSAGACNVCVPDFDPERCLQVLQQERVSVSFMVPSMINMLLTQANLARYDLSTWRLVLYGASPMPEALIRRTSNTLGVGLLQGYGLTEAGIDTYLRPEDHVLDGSERMVARLRSAGRVSPDFELRVVDNADQDVQTGEVGEVLVRGAAVMLGYWKQPELTAEALRGGWMHTGDLACLDTDGYVYIVDRKKDMIITGGENVYSTEVEAVLYQHPAVLEAAVIGVPDVRWGETVKAVVVLKPGHTVSLEELQRFCRERIAGYKAPRSVAFCDALPRTATGKTSKRSLRAPYWAAQSDHGSLTDALLDTGARRANAPFQ